MTKRNFLLGKGERLTANVTINTGGAPKIPPYTFDESVTRIKPMLDSVVEQIDALPADACPSDLAMATITLNPEYIAKSYHPLELLRAVGLETVGSRPRIITPKKRSKERTPEETITTELFVVGKRQAFRKWANEIASWSEALTGAKQLVELEEVSFPNAMSKVKGINNAEKNDLFEVVLHLKEDEAESGMLGQFKEYLNKLNVQAQFTHRFYAGGLCFVEIEAPKDLVNEIANYSLVRVVRQMPKLRLLNPAFRITGFDKSESISLPTAKPMDENIKVAIFDGGIPANHPITRWAKAYDTIGIGLPEDSLFDHGVAVTSAFLFGHIEPGKPLPAPFSYVDHYRVLDNDPSSNPYELYEVLDRISNVLATTHYDFINLSLGPVLPIEDDEVHAWTAVLDEYLADGKALATIAVGNDGEGDASIGANRIQVPADCVNALSVGACDLPDAGWKRATYSSIGPGRSPGIVKPDLVDFGGSIGRPFLTLDSKTGTKLSPTGGTSFAAPAILRLGVGVKAHFGNALNPLAIRALLVHCAESTEIHPYEIGWGRVARSINDIVICGDNMIRVVFQGKIRASKYLRAQIPLPNGDIKGKVKIKATLLYTTACDANHPENYTRSGLDVTFRPHKDRRTIVPGSPIPVHPAPKPFFQKQQKSFQSEDVLRRDAWKWENCLHSEVNFLGKSLRDSFFDIHYNARMESHNDTRSQELEYAMVITVEAKNVADLYDQVVRKYATLLEPLIPSIDIPIPLAS